MKTIFSKFYKTVFSVTLVWAGVSCSDDLLYPEPTTGVSDEHAINNERSAITALNGTYNRITSSATGTYSFITFLFSDNVEYVGMQGANVFVHDADGKTAFQSNNGSLRSIWTSIYETVNNANHLIEKIDKIQDENFTRAERDEILGQAYFIRALSYFDLIRYWGGVQLVLRPTTSPTDVVGIKRSTLEQTYEQVNEDLAKAESLLKQTNSRIRIDLGVVQALIARVALYQKQWERAETYATKLIDHPKYALVKPYQEFYRNKASTESIFELNFTTSNTNAGSRWKPAELGGSYEITTNAAVTALLLDPNVGGNRSALIGITPQLHQQYITMYWRPQNDNPEYLFRIAEQILIRAEARVHRNNLSGSLDDLNKIRDRAEIPLLTDSEYDTPEKALLAIENERRLEFVIENHRYFDLQRTGRLQAVLKEKEGYLFPIPYEEMLLDPDLEPNPSN
ncbi:MAG: RagB/SusD family nutrient uptake outer membrane protein [Dysgonamonadaceae bacterium]|jgi:hypothetical protein|nr:RagB/SusD family nutrient uptake outer membrane protein [Dysgonamonadaceae bacterium]